MYFNYFNCLLKDEASTVSESEDALLWNEERAQTSVDNWNVIPNAHMLEQLSNEHISQDTSKTEVQLRFFIFYFLFLTKLLIQVSLQIFIAIVN